MKNLFCIRPKGFNVGNDAIYMAMQHFIYNAFGEVVNLISLPATSRYENHANAGLTSRTIYDINQYGHGVIIGGGNLYENGELDVNLDALQALEVPMMIFSVSRGRVYNRSLNLVARTDTMPDRVMQALDQKSCAALFRDHATGDHLKKIGCKHTDVGGCPTVFLDRIAHRLPQVPENLAETALVSVRIPSLMSIPLDRQSQVYGDIQRIIELLRARGFQDTRLLCHDHRDIAFAASFSGIDYVYTGDVYTYLAMLRECALNVSYRLHSFLPCMSFGRPTIKISYDERALSLIETVGLDDWNINMVEQPNVAEQVVNRLDRLSELNERRAELKSDWHSMYCRFDRQFREFAQHVEGYHQSTKRTHLRLEETLPPSEIISPSESMSPSESKHGSESISNLKLRSA